MASISEAIRNWFVEPVLNELKRMVHTMADQKADLDSAISAQNAVLQDVLAKVTKVGTDIDALLAKINAGTPVVDLSTEIQAIQSQTASLQSVADQLTADDTKANPA